MRICFSIQCLRICTGGGRWRRHKSQLNGDWYLHKLLPVLVCPQSQCAQPHTNHRTSAQLSIMTQSNIWANHSNKPRTIVETTAGQWPRPALVWTSGPHLTAAVCLLSIIISWHRLYLLYLVSTQYLGPHSIYITRLWDTTTCRRDMAVAPPSPGCKEGKYAERIYLNLHDFLCLVANLSE